MNNHILLIDCKDSKGLIYKITGVLYKNDLNIVGNAEFVDKNGEQFFMRTEIAGEVKVDKILKELKSVLPEGVSVRLLPRRKKNIVLLATKEHHCLSDLLIRNHYHELDCNILAVISNYNELRELTEKFNVPYHFVSHEGLSREDHEREIMKVMQGYNPEYIVLAKYMRILSSSFVNTFHNKIINIHHSFLPAFVGANPYYQAFERGVKIIGATAHFVNDLLDEGPIIAQSIIPVAHSYNATDMREAGKDVEKIVLAKSLKLVLEDKVFVYRNKTIIFD